MLLKKVSPFSILAYTEGVTSVSRLICSIALTNSRNCRGLFGKTWKSDRKHGYESERQFDWSNVAQESGSLTD